jgi:hypothetical protein
LEREQRPFSGVYLDVEAVHTFLCLGRWCQFPGRLCRYLTQSGDTSCAASSDAGCTSSGGANTSLPLHTGATSSGGTETGGTLLGGQPLTIAIPSLQDFFSNPGSITITPDPSTLFGSLLGDLGVMNLLQNPGDFVGGIEGVLNSLHKRRSTAAFSR